MKIQLLFLTFLVLTIQKSTTEPQCRNQNDELVDWFIILKHPQGTEYSYCDSNECTQLRSTGLDLNNPKDSPLLNTLKQIQKVDSSEYGSIFWNDQPPQQKASFNVAHSKGVMGFGQNQGFILIHSAPKFPEIINKEIVLQIESGQLVFGQHFFCISSSTSELDAIAQAYNVDWPMVYDGNVAFEGLQYLKDMLNNERNEKDHKLTVEFTSLQGTKFLKMAKSGHWEVPFYDNVVTEQLKTGLYVESWGSPQENSDCHQQYEVLSNIEVKMPTGEKYKFTKDHSKYAISSNPTTPFVCLGDINRQNSQWKRGGGTICFRNGNAYKAFQEIMVVQQTCEQ
ncbi:hypothetical protein IMG5_145810 [Ichthyophthirius multifiliis]|uniref:Uncharacterized protein n=1 Tax=Ichthyophthirius multifiliis TaxID=5932 RepID=G0QXX4_ICHMU|nr:hypothetical protein IMG5_145810 [Ichthyophthirius multifiliis]EGR29926.1 hypothetical protein IMG5_145810 [Ichthyophthirius multifiliis]|eukprot:XP_004031162.1 hypothetical protein IMG5_145810 [Ichthyophthirius multifiliis]